MMLGIAVAESGRQVTELLDNQRRSGIVIAVGHERFDDAQALAEGRTSKPTLAGGVRLVGGAGAEVAALAVEQQRLRSAKLPVARFAEVTVVLGSLYRNWP